MLRVIAFSELYNCVVIGLTIAKEIRVIIEQLT